MKKLSGGKKPKNQGSAGKAPTQKPLTAKKASPRGGKVYQTTPPKGTRGSRKA